MMIEQLLENTVTSLDVARQELDTYNRHQAEINRINSQMAAIDQTLDESREQLGSIQTAIKCVSRRLKTFSASGRMMSGRAASCMSALTVFPPSRPGWLTGRKTAMPSA